MAKKTPRAGRTLIIFGIAVALLYAAAALGKDWSPQLGLDLEGGTRITLTADEGATSQTQLKLASSIIDERVNGSGVSESEVSTQGNKNIVVEIPGKQRKDLIDAVKRTAQLRFRLVCRHRRSRACRSRPLRVTPRGGVAERHPEQKATAKPTGKPPPAGTATPKPRPAPGRRHPDRPAPSPTSPPTGRREPRPPSAGASPAPPRAGRLDRRPAGVAARPRQRVAREFSAVHLPPEGPEPRPGRRRPGPAADHLRRQGQQVPAVQGDDRGHLAQDRVRTASRRTASAGRSTWRSRAGPQRPSPTSPSSSCSTGRTFAIVLDGKVLSAPQVNDADPRRQRPDHRQLHPVRGAVAGQLAEVRRAAVKFNQPTVETIGPSLAGDQLAAGVLAGIVGLALVMIYCLLYYRGLGLVVVASLIIAASITYAMVLVLAKTSGLHAHAARHRGPDRGGGHHRGLVHRVLRADP